MLHLLHHQLLLHILLLFLLYLLIALHDLIDVLDQRVVAALAVDVVEQTLEALRVGARRKQRGRDCWK